MKRIPVNNGKHYAIVDDDDYEYLSEYKWYAAGSRKDYACRQFQKNRVKHYVYMHREIMQAPKDKVVDHINGDTLDNRKSNLRICTVTENSRNSRKSKSNTTGYKGVHYYKARNNYSARIRVDGKDIHLGYFKTPEEAHVAYSTAANIYFGEFARLS